MAGTRSNVRTKRCGNAIKNARGRRRDVEWKHATSVDNKPSKMKCNYCLKEYSSSAFRLKHHLAGTHKNIGACTSVPHEVCQQMLDKLERNHIKNDGERKMKTKITQQAPVEKVVDLGGQATRSKLKFTSKISRSLMPKPSGLPLRNKMPSRKSTRLSAQTSALTHDLPSDQAITKKEFEEFKKDCQDFWKYMKKVGDYQKNMGWSLADINKESFPQFPNHILETTQEKEDGATYKGKEKKGYSQKKKATAGKKKKAKKDVEPPMEETLEEHEEEEPVGEKVLEEQAEHQNEGSLAEEESVLNIQDVEEEEQLDEENVMKEDNVAEEVTDKKSSKKKKQPIQEPESVEVQVEEQAVPHDTSENSSIRKVMYVYESKKWSTWSTLDKAIKDGTDQEKRPKRKQDEKARVEKPMLEPVKKKTRTNSKFKFTKK